MEDIVSEDIIIAYIDQEEQFLRSMFKSQNELFFTLNMQGATTKIAKIIYKKELDGDYEYRGRIFNNDPKSEKWIWLEGKVRTLLKELY